MQRLNTLLTIDEEKRPQATVDPFNANQAIDIQLQDVHFSYDDEKKILNSLSLSIPTGKRVALVGASGGGKSTLIQLL